MTDKEIEKALKNCWDEHDADCNCCPYFDRNCHFSLHIDALNYINRLKAKINRLEQYDKERDIRLHAGLIERTRKETAKEIYNDFKGFIFEDEASLLVWLQAIIQKYGVEVGE